MCTPTEIAFLKALDKKFLTAADRFRFSLDAAMHKHAVLGIIYPMYVNHGFAGTTYGICEHPSCTLHSHA